MKQTRLWVRLVCLLIAVLMIFSLGVSVVWQLL